MRTQKHPGRGLTLALALVSYPLLADRADAGDSFASRMFAELPGRDENALFSPLSVSVALGMALEGAKGRTAEEIAGGLGRGGPGGGRNLSAVVDSLAVGEPRVAIANALVLTGGLKPNAGFRKRLEDGFRSEIFPGDLAAINAWTSEKTRGKIPKILEELDPSSVFVILNAVYFMGKWESPFDRAATRDAPFFGGREGDRETKVLMMFQGGSFRHFKGEGFRSVALPYRGDGRRWSMVVMLPDERDGVTRLEDSLAAGGLAEAISSTLESGHSEVDVFLPKFKVESKYDLVGALASLGVRDAFTGDADFSGILGEPGDIAIGKVVHKAYVEVDEEKTEAAAATAIDMAVTGMPVGRTEFRADRPFIFAICDEEDGEVLFLGRILSPST